VYHAEEGGKSPSRKILRPRPTPLPEPSLDGFVDIQPLFLYVRRRFLARFRKARDALRALEERVSLLGETKTSV